jgi:RNA polymerase sigma-70 factor (ECF subfamily)
MAEQLEAGQLLSAARAGSREALGQVLEGCRNYLLLIAERELDTDLRAKGGASDLVQQTFLEAHKDFDHFAGNTSDELRAWLRRMLLNNVANFTRHYRDAAKRCVGREQALAGPDSAADPAAQLAADTPTPSVQMMASEQAQALQRALERLPEDYRRIVVLRYQEQLSFPEIGRLMDRTENAARLLWLRAVERLEEEMRPPS